MISPLTIIESFVAFILALLVHNMAQATVASALGDPTPRKKGRMSLLPQRQMSAIGTIVAIVSSYSVSAGVGWGKPLELDAHSLRPGPNAGTIIVALTGPVVNALVGVGVSFGLTFVPGYNQLVTAWPICVGGAPGPAVQQCLSAAQPAPLLFTEQFLFAFAVANVVLAILNLIPLHPLDGYHVVFALLPSAQAIRYRNWIPYMEFTLLVVFFVIPYILQVVRVSFDPAGIIGEWARSLCISIAGSVYSFYLIL